MRKGYRGKPGDAPETEAEGAVLYWVERFDRRGTEPFELFRSEFGQNSWNRKKTTKNYFIEVACDPKYKTGPQKNQEKGNKLL